MSTKLRWRDRARIAEREVMKLREELASEEEAINARWRTTFEDIWGLWPDADEHTREWVAEEAARREELRVTENRAHLDTARELLRVQTLVFEANCAIAQLHKDRELTRATATPASKDLHAPE